MATHRIALFGPSTLPDTTGNAFFEPASIENVNDLFAKLIAVFQDDAADSKIGFSVRVPKNYVGSARIGGVFYTTATTGNYIWRVEYEAAASGESADPSAVDETVTSGAITVPGTARDETEQSLALTSSNLAIDDRLTGHIVARTSDAGYTLTAKLMAHPEMFYFEYADA